MPPLPPVTQFLMLACTAVFCAQQLFFAIDAWLALWPLSTGRFMPWQPVTYAFLHGDFLHLLFNMLALWTFGSELERLWGNRRYLQFLLASVLAAAALQLLVTWLMGSPARTVGASGGVLGLLLAYGVLFPNRELIVLPLPIPIKAKVLVIFYGALSLFLGLSGAGGVAHFAHLGGMLGGWLMLQYWRGRPPFGGGRGPRRMR